MTESKSSAPTESPSAPTRVEMFAPWVAGLLLALPVLIARYPPMTDLPLHEGLVGILRHFDDTAMFPPGLYARNFGQPNQLFHLLALALSYVFATDTACKIVVAATVVAIPVCAARFASHIGANRLAAVVVAPVALGWMFSWGLVANLIGLAMFLALLPALDRLAASPTPRAALLAIGGALVMHLAHEAMMVIYAGAAFWLACCHPFAPKKTLLRLSPFVAAVTLNFWLLASTRSHMSPTLKAIPTMWVPISAKLMYLPAVVIPSHDRVVQLAFFGLCALAVVVFFVLRHRERTEPMPRKIMPFVLRYRFELFAAACFGAYLAFPLTLNGATLVYQRFLPPAFVLLVIVAAPRSLAARSARVMRLLVPALPVAALLIAWPSFTESHEAYKDLDQILAQMDKGAAVAVVDLASSETRSFSLGPAPARYLAVGGGRLHYAFTDSPIAPAMLRPEYQWNEPLVRISKSGWAFRPNHDFKHFRYVIVRSVDPQLLVLAAYAMKPEARVISNAGEWLLLESNLEVVSLLSQDDPLPQPKAPSLRQRMKKSLDELTKDNPIPPPELGSEQEQDDPARGLAMPQ